MNVPPEMMAQVLEAGAGPASGAAAGAAPPSAPAAPMDMGPDQAVQLLQQHGITPENAPMIAQALMVVQGSMDGGAMPPPDAGMPPQGGMPPVA